MINPNAETIEAWNTVLFEKFVRFRHLVCSALGQHGRETMRRYPPAEGARVLDVGCGFGDTAQELAALVGADGEIVGVDCAPNFVEAATREAAQAGIDNVRFLAADVEWDDLGGPYDLAFSRFGTMFFNNPVAALRNIRRSLTDEGELVMAVWRSKSANEWAQAAEECVRRFISESDEDHSAVTCGPGPFSMASPDVVSEQMIIAGYRDITFTRYDAPLCIGRNMDDAIAFGMALGPAGEAVRLAGAKTEQLRPQIEAAMREQLSGFVREDGIYAASSTWIVHARAS